LEGGNREARKQEGAAREQRQAAVERLDLALAGDSVSLGTVETLHQTVAAAEGAVRLAEARLERVLARLEDRLRRVSLLERDGEAAVAATRPAGARDVAGSWRLEIQPQGGVATLTLHRDGATVTGTLMLAGSPASGVRGTFSKDSLRFERQNARGEIEAVFLGTLDASGRLSGEWRASSFSQGKPVTGNWRAERVSTTG